jgi:hypothetical protein
MLSLKWMHSFLTFPTLMQGVNLPSFQICNSHVTTIFVQYSTHILASKLELCNLYAMHVFFTNQLEENKCLSIYLYFKIHLGIF